MAANAGIQIPIVTSYVGTGVKNATKDLGIMNTAAEKMGSTLKRYLGAAVVEEFARRSINAFVEEQKAITVLGQTLDNLGLGFAKLPVEEFITKLQLATGVTKETLIPAFQTLVRYTSDATKAQELLSLSLDIAAGTGKDVASVSLALGKAYGGNTVALGRLGAGLDKTTLNSKNFALVQQKLTSLFKGDAAKAAETYQGKIDRLKAGFHELEQTVGGGLINAFQNLSGKNGSIDGAISGMQTFGNIAYYVLDSVTKQVGALASKLGGQGGILGFLETGIGGTLIKKFLKSLADTANFEAYNRKVKANTNDLKNYYDNLNKQNTILSANKKAQSALDTKAVKDAQAKLAAEKASAVLKQAAQINDIQQAEIIAGLQGKITDQDRTRLELQLALLQNNADAAGKLAQQVLADQAAALSVQALNPFDGWALGALRALDAVKSLQDELVKLGTPIGTAQGYALNSAGLARAADDAAAIAAGMGGSSSIGSTASDILSSSAYSASQGNTAASSGLYSPQYLATGRDVNVTISMDPNTGNLISTVQQGIVSNTASGTPSSFVRSTPNGGW